MFPINNECDIPYIPDVGIDYGHLQYIALNWYKPTHNPRCAWAIGPHKTWKGQLRVWGCNRKGTYTLGGVHLCGTHIIRANSLHPVTELPFRLFSYYQQLVTTSDVSR